MHRLIPLAKQQCEGCCSLCSSLLPTILLTPSTALTRARRDGQGLVEPLGWMERRPHQDLQQLGTTLPKDTIIGAAGVPALLHYARVTGALVRGCVCVCKNALYGDVAFCPSLHIINLTVPFNMAFITSPCTSFKATVARISFLLFN